MLAPESPLHAPHGSPFPFLSLDGLTVQKYILFSLTLYFYLIISYLALYLLDTNKFLQHVFFCDSFLNFATADEYGSVFLIFSSV